MSGDRQGCYMTRIKAKIYSSPDKCMAGTELKRLREAAGLTQEQLAAKLEPWGWYRQKIVDCEHNGRFCLHPDEMQALLDALGATSL